jgi:hypothetical protein
MALHLAPVTWLMRAISQSADRINFKQDTDLLIRPDLVAVDMAVPRSPRTQWSRLFVAWPCAGAAGSGGYPRVVRADRAIARNRASQPPSRDPVEHIGRGLPRGRLARRHRRKYHQFHKRDQAQRRQPKHALRALGHLAVISLLIWRLD